MNTQKNLIPMTNKSYDIEDMISMFGDRIKPAIHEDEYGKALVAVELRKLFRKWKKNADIKEACKYYAGLLLVPWVVDTIPTKIICSEGVMNKRMENKY